MRKTDIAGLMAKFRRAARIHFSAKDMRAFADIVRTERMKAFDDGRAPDGSRWEKLKAKTIERKKKRGSKTPDKPLMDKGYLRLPTIETKTDEARVKIAKSREEIGPYHNAGGGSLPRREHWAVYPQALVQIERLKEAIFTRKIREIFG